MGVTFKDTSGEIYDCTIKVADIRRIHKELEINLANLAEASGDGRSPLVMLTTDPMAFGDVIWALIKPQAASRGLASQEAFEHLLDGPATAGAFDAFWEALRLFFRSRGQIAFVAVINRQLEAINSQHKEAAQLANEINLGEVARLRMADLRARIATQLPGSFATSSPASSESTPTPTPSAS